MKTIINVAVETREAVPIADMVHNAPLDFEYVCQLTGEIIECLIY